MYGFENVCLVPVVVLVAVLLPHSLSHVNMLLLWRDRTPVTMALLFVGMRSKSFYAVIDKASCGGALNAPSVLPR